MTAKRLVATETSRFAPYIACDEDDGYDPVDQKSFRNKGQILGGKQIPIDGYSLFFFFKCLALNEGKKCAKAEEGQPEQLVVRIL